MELIDVIILWSMIAISAIGFYILNKQKYVLSDLKSYNKISDKNKQIIYYVILAFIFIVGCVIRLYGISDIPRGVNVDEAMAAYDAYALATEGTDRFGMSYPVHFTAWETGQMSVLLSYLMVPFIKVFGFSTTVIRMPMAILSIVGMVFMYLLALEVSEELFKKKKTDVESRLFALCVLAFVAINPWHIMQSRWSIDCNVLPHFFIIGLYFLLKGSKKARYYYISMIFFAACMYSYGLAFVSIPLFLLVSCTYLLVKKQIKWLEALQSAIIYFVLSLPIYLVMIINTLHLETIKIGAITIPYFPDSVRSGDLLFFAEDKLVQLQNNFWAVIYLLLYQNERWVWNAVEGFGTIYLFSLPFVILGAIVLFKRAKGNAKLQLIKFGFLTGIFLGFMVVEVNVSRLNIIFYMLIFLQAIGVYYSIRAISKKRIMVYILIMYMIVFGEFTKTYFTTHQETLELFFNAGFQDALDYAEELDPEIYYITRGVAFGGEGNPKSAEILTLYHNKPEIAYYQGETNVEHGVRRLTYNLRYQYIVFDPNQISDEMGCVYILLDRYWDAFDENEYDKVRFVNFFVASEKIDK